MVLTPTEQKIYREFYKQQIFQLEDCIKFLKGNYRAALVATKNLVEKKYILKIKRGIFCVIPYEKTYKWFGEYLPDKFLIADHLVQESFLSHNTALELYGLTAHEKQDVYLCSKNKIPDIKINSYNFATIKTKFFFGYDEIVHKGHKIKVSDKERTIIDCLRNINYTCGLEELLNIFKDWGSVDFEKMFDYLCKVDEVSLYSRVGYVLDLLKFHLKTPDWFRTKISKKLNDRTYYLDMSKKGSSKHVRDWKLMVPEFVFKMDI